MDVVCLCALTGLCVFPYLRWLTIVLVNSFVILVVLFHRFFGKANHIIPTEESMISHGYRNDSRSFKTTVNILNIWIHFLIYKDSSNESRPGKTLK